MRSHRTYNNRPIIHQRPWEDLLQIAQGTAFPYFYVVVSNITQTLGKTSGRASRSLADNGHWNEIATLIRLALVAGNQSKQTSHHQLYVPELVHIVTITAGTGQTLVRKSVYGIVINLLQSLYLARAEDASGPDLLALITDCTTPEALRLFGLARTTPTSEYTNHDPPNDKALLDVQEGLTNLLVRIMDVTAGSQGVFAHPLVRC
jgi:hypothetical protein